MNINKINNDIKKKGFSKLSDKEKEYKARDIWKKRSEKNKWSSEFENEEIFVKWYLEQKRECCCCHVNEEIVRHFFYDNEDNKKMTRGGRRGHMLELDKIDNFISDNGKLYSEKNCGLLCYPCNNAKSNLCNDYESFIPIANGIKEFWDNQKD